MMPDPEDSLPPWVEIDCYPPDNLDPENPNLSREEWAETRTCQVCGIAGEDVSASRRCSSCEKHDIMPESRWEREHSECL